MGRVRISQKEAKYIKAMKEKGFKLKEISEITGRSYPTIRKALNGDYESQKFYRLELREEIVNGVYTEEFLAKQPAYIWELFRKVEAKEVK